MTATEIQNLGGVELAREVARSVMNWHSHNGNPCIWIGASGLRESKGLRIIDDEGSFRPDSDGNAMLEVVERMRKETT